MLKFENQNDLMHSNLIKNSYLLMKLYENNNMQSNKDESMNNCLGMYFEKTYLIILLLD